MVCHMKLLFLLPTLCVLSFWGQTVLAQESEDRFLSETNSKAVIYNKSTCWLEIGKKWRDQLSLILEDKVKLIEMTIYLEGHPPDMLKHVLKDLYNPYHWILSTSGQGRRLLMLDDNYRYKSMSTLSIGVATMELNVTDQPVRCMRGRDQEDTLTIVRESILRNFKSPIDEPTDTADLQDHICNTQIVRNGDYAEFRYRCCQMSSDRSMTCHDLAQDDWVKLLLALIIIIKILVVLYSPMFVPDSLYRTKYVAGQYIYHVQGSPITLKVAVTQHPAQFGATNQHKTVRLSTLKNMEYFKAMVSNSPWCPDKIYEVHIKEVRICVKARRLLGILSFPVTIVTLLYNHLLRCRIRRLEPLQACCGADILGKFNPGLHVITWHKLMKVCAQLILFALLATPWIIRTILYFVYEADVIENKKRVAQELGLTVTFPASIVKHLTPIHGLFLVIYVIFIIDSVIYGVISDAMKEKFKCITRQCLRDMRERSRMTILAWITTLAVLPFKVFGIVGLILFVPYLPILLIITLPFIIFYIFPTINFSLRLLIHIFMFMCPHRVMVKFEEWSGRLRSVKKHLHTHEVTAKENFLKKQQYTSTGVLLQLTVIIMCLVSFWSVTLLLMEITSFFVEISVYTFMGVVVNAQVTLQYITVILLVFMYSKNIFSRVSRLYQSYHKVVHRQLMAMAREEINKVALQEALDQENTAFIVRDDSTSQESQFYSPRIRVKNHQPQWMTSGMLVFLDKHDTPLTPEKFFYETIDLNYFGCPGPIYRNVCSAVWEFLRIILFLLFVFVVVMALGDAYQISTTNQLLATVVGGFLPFIFRHIFTSSTAVDHIDTSGIQFQTEFQKTINSFTQSWPVFDIIPVSIQELDMQESPNKSDETILQPKITQSPPTSTSSVSSTEDVDAAVAATVSGDNTEDVNAAVAATVSGGNTEGLVAAPLGIDGAVGTGCNGDEISVHNESSSLQDADNANVDIIVDVSSSKTRAGNVLLSKDLEKGSVSMLDPNIRNSGSKLTYLSSLQDV